MDEEPPSHDNLTCNVGCRFKRRPSWAAEHVDAQHCNFQLVEAHVGGLQLEVALSLVISLI